MPAARKHLEYIDAAKAVSIIMIMYGHVTELGNPADTWMSSCKICVFYVISGFLMAHTNALERRTPREFTVNICRTLAWPYLTFSVIAIIFRTARTFLRHEGAAAVIRTFRGLCGQTVFLAGINSMWFLPTLFFGEIIVMLLWHGPKVLRYLYGAAGLFGVKGAVALNALIASTGLSEAWEGRLAYTVNMLGKSCVAAWFVGAGYIIYMLMKKKDLLEGHGRAKLAAGIVFTVSNVFLSQLNRSVDFNSMDMGKRPWLFVYGGIIGSIGIILLLDAASQRVSLGRLNYWGRNSLILMCTHTALKFRALAVAGWKDIMYIPDQANLEYIIETLMTLALMMLMMYGVIEIINRYFPWLTRYKTKAHSKA